MCINHFHNFLFKPFSFFFQSYCYLLAIGFQHPLALCTGASSTYLLTELLEPSYALSSFSMYLITEDSSTYLLYQLSALSYTFSYLFSVSSCTLLELLLPTRIWLSAPTCIFYFTLTVGDSSTYLLQALGTLLRFVLITFTFTCGYFTLVIPCHQICLIISFGLAM